MDVSKNMGKTPKMDGENNGKPYEQMDDLGVFPLFLECHPYLCVLRCSEMIHPSKPQT